MPSRPLHEPDTSVKFSIVSVKEKRPSAKCSCDRPGETKADAVVPVVGVVPVAVRRPSPGAAAPGAAPVDPGFVMTSGAGRVKRKSDQAISAHETDLARRKPMELKKLRWQGLSLLRNTTGAVASLLPQKPPRLTRLTRSSSAAGPSGSREKAAKCKVLM